MAGKCDRCDRSDKIVSLSQAYDRMGRVKFYCLECQQYLGLQGKNQEKESVHKDATPYHGPQI